MVNDVTLPFLGEYYLIFFTGRFNVFKSNWRPEKKTLKGKNESLNLNWQINISTLPWKVYAYLLCSNDIFCIQITFNKSSKACFSNEKYTVSIQTHILEKKIILKKRLQLDFKRLLV